METIKKLERIKEVSLYVGLVSMGIGLLIAGIGFLRI